MNKDQRAPWVFLTHQIGAVLCTTCRYGEWDGWCCEGSYQCDHRLEAVAAESERGMTPGDDCWGFRPEWKLWELGELVGIILEYCMSSWYFYRTAKGIKVVGESHLLRRKEGVRV